MYGFIWHLSWVGSLVLQDLDELVEASCDDRAEKRSDPVDPMVMLEAMDDYTRPKRASWIERTCARSVGFNEGQLRETDLQ